MADGNNNNNAGNADALNEGTEAAIKHAKAVKEVTDKYGDYEKQLEAIKKVEEQIAAMGKARGRKKQDKLKQILAICEMNRHVDWVSADMEVFEEFDVIIKLLKEVIDE